MAAFKARTSATTQQYHAFVIEGEGPQVEDIDEQVEQDAEFASFIQQLDEQTDDDERYIYHQLANYTTQYALTGHRRGEKHSSG